MYDEDEEYEKQIEDMKEFFFKDIEEIPNGLHNACYTVSERSLIGDFTIDAETAMKIHALVENVKKNGMPKEYVM